MTTPRISVLLPVRDARPWIESSLRSLSRQSFTDFEIIAVDDGSADGSGEWLELAARREPRLRVIRTAARGLPAALATALGAARGSLLARHDADDLSHRDRLALQVAHLECHPADALVGARFRLFPTRAVTPAMKRWARWQNGLLEHEAIRRDALVDLTLTHGTALFRREWVERAGGWRECGWPEDVDLSLRLIRAGARFAKLPRTLYAWRQHGANATRRDPRYSAERFGALRLDALERDFLSARGGVTVVGVGASLERWRAALAARGHAPSAVEARAPGQLALPLEGPLVLVFGTPALRERWRAALGNSGRREGREFAFVT